MLSGDTCLSRCVAVCVRILHAGVDLYHHYSLPDAAEWAVNSARCYRFWCYFHFLLLLLILLIQQLPLPMLLHLLLLMLFLMLLLVLHCRRGVTASFVGEASGGGSQVSVWRGDGVFGVFEEFVVSLRL